MAYRRFASHRHLPAPAALPLLLLAMAGCASTMDVRPLATERVDVSAYELTGSDLAALRREASQLCPQGGEILRQSARDQRLESIDSRMARWAHLSTNWVMPSEQHAQLVVLCNAAPGRQLLAAAVAARPASDSMAALAAGSTPAPAVPVPARSLPIGPVTVEW